MDILESLEARWFFAGHDPNIADLNDWFKDVPIENDGRRDFYYFDPQRPDLNAKERTGEGKPPKLEFKYRVGILGSTRFTPSVVGQLERWIKVSVALPSAAISSDARCVEVKKKRRLRKFKFEAGTCVEVSAKDRPEAGCGVEFTELTGVRAGGSKQGCSFGLEAFGPPPVSLEGLQNTIRMLAAERPSLRLDAAQSSNYSSWLIGEFANHAWSHRINAETPYYENPAQGRPASGTIPGGTLCRILSDGGSYVHVSTSLGVSGYVASSALSPL